MSNDKDEDLMSKDKDEDLKIGPQGSSRTRTFLEDSNTGVRQYGEIDMNLNLTGAQWQISRSSLGHCKTMVLDISHATLAYSILFEDLNFRGREQGLENWFSRILNDKDFPRGQQHWILKCNCDSPELLLICSCQQC